MNRDHQNTLPINVQVLNEKGFSTNQFCWVVSCILSMGVGVDRKRRYFGLAYRAEMIEIVVNLNPFDSYFASVACSLFACSFFHFVIANSKSSSSA